jgi:Domain of unknown function (DUF4375)
MKTLRKIIILTMFASLFKLFGYSGQDNNDNSKIPNDTLGQQISKSIKDFKNRPIYKKLTTDIIDMTPDDQLVQTVYDYLSQKTPNDRNKEYQTVLSWTKSQQSIYIIWGLEAEVNNGGYNQFYHNSIGQFADLTPNALRLVGALKFADLTEKANNIYETEKEKIIKNQDGTIEGFSKSYEDNPLEKLDTEFYDLYTKEDLQKLQVDFIRKHKNQFIEN